jgi:hypothetical protein
MAKHDQVYTDADSWRAVILDCDEDADFKRDEENNQEVATKGESVLGTFDHDLRAGVVLGGRAHRDQHSWRRSLPRDTIFKESVDEAGVKVVEARNPGGDVVGFYTEMGGPGRGVVVSEARKKAPVECEVGWEVQYPSVPSQQDAETARSALEGILKDSETADFDQSEDASEPDYRFVGASATRSGNVVRVRATLNFDRLPSEDFLDTIAHEIRHNYVADLPNGGKITTHWGAEPGAVAEGIGSMSSREQHYHRHGMYPFRHAYLRVKVGDVVGWFGPSGTVEYGTVLAKEPGGYIKTDNGTVTGADVVTIKRGDQFLTSN